MDQATADIYCKGLGGRLAFFRSDYEFFQYSLLKPFRAMEWAGIKKYGYRWKNLDGSTPFLNWYPGEPNNHGGREACVDIVAVSGSFQMNDENCARRLQFTCRFN